MLSTNALILDLQIGLNLDFLPRLYVTPPATSKVGLHVSPWSSFELTWPKKGFQAPLAFGKLKVGLMFGRATQI